MSNNLYSSFLPIPHCNIKGTTRIHRTDKIFFSKKSKRTKDLNELLALGTLQILAGYKTLMLNFLDS